MEITKNLSVDKIVTELENRKYTIKDGKLFYSLYFEMSEEPDQKWLNIFQSMESKQIADGVKMKGKYFVVTGDGLMLNVPNTNIDELPTYEQGLDDLFNMTNSEYSAGEDALVLAEIEKIKIYLER